MQTCVQEELKQCSYMQTCVQEELKQCSYMQTCVQEELNRCSCMQTCVQEEMKLSTWTEAVSLYMQTYVLQGNNAVFMQTVSVSPEYKSVCIQLQLYAVLH